MRIEILNENKNNNRNLTIKIMNEKIHKKKLNNQLNMIYLNLYSKNKGRLRKKESE